MCVCVCVRACVCVCAPAFASDCDFEPGLLSQTSTTVRVITVMIRHQSAQARTPRRSRGALPSSQAPSRSLSSDLSHTRTQADIPHFSHPRTGLGSKRRNRRLRGRAFASVHASVQCIVGVETSLHLTLTQAYLCHFLDGVFIPIAQGNPVLPGNA